MDCLANIFFFFNKVVHVKAATCSQICRILIQLKTCWNVERIYILLGSCWSHSKHNILGLSLISVPKPRYSLSGRSACSHRMCLTDCTKTCISDITTAHSIADVRALFVQRDNRHLLSLPADVRKTKNKTDEQTWRQPFDSLHKHNDTHRVLGEMLPDGLALQVAVLEMIFRHAHCSNMASAKKTAACQEKKTPQ